MGWAAEEEDVPINPIPKHFQVPSGSFPGAPRLPRAQKGVPGPKRSLGRKGFPGVQGVEPPATMHEAVFVLILQQVS